MNSLKMELPQGIATVLDILEKAGHEGWLVGGCVRDAVMGVVPHDYDITSSSVPDEILSIFEGYRVVETGLKHGTVTVLIEGEAVEITTFRMDGDYLDNRHPSEVRFTRNIEEDLGRRDFTVNAMAYHPRKGLLDLFGGCDDIRCGVIRCVGDAGQRFREDGLRIMRALRFASRLGFELERETDRAVRELSGLLGGISAERLYSELCGILMGRNAGEIILRYAQVIAVFIPELKEIAGFAQNSKYHCWDVLEHTCRAIDGAPLDRTVRLALLLHDLGKPKACFRGNDGYDHYAGHEEISADMADEILVRLRADGLTRRTVVKLISMHDCTVIPDERHAKRLLRKLSYDEARLLMDLKIGDRSAHAPEFSDNSDILCMRQLIDELEERGECLSLSALAIGGRELIALGMKPGKAIGDVLDRLLETVVNGEVENEREALTELARRIIQNTPDGE